LSDVKSQTHHADLRQMPIAGGGKPAPPPG
jgi:hypothetical protein